MTSDQYEHKYISRRPILMKLMHQKSRFHVEKTRRSTKRKVAHTWPELEVLINVERGLKVEASVFLHSKQTLPGSLENCTCHCRSRLESLLLAVSTVAPLSGATITIHLTLSSVEAVTIAL